MALVSVVIPTFNEEGYIESCLSALREQSHRNLEIIVVDGRSSDLTAKLARRLADKVLVKPSLPSEARNLGASMAKGDYLLFLDADLILAHDYVQRAIASAEAKDAIAVVGKTYPKEDHSKARIMGFLFGTSSKLLSLLGFPFPIGGMLVLARKEVKGLKFSNIVSEDTLWFKQVRRLGKVVYEPRCRARVWMRRFERGGYVRQALIWLLGWLRAMCGLRKKGLDAYERFR
jgi:glycosyltransferase involved in cell wall biosynthesis